MMSCRYKTKCKVYNPKDSDCKAGGVHCGVYKLAVMKDIEDDEEEIFSDMIEGLRKKIDFRDLSGRVE